MANQVFWMCALASSLTLAIGIIIGSRVSNVSEKDIERVRHDAFLQGFNAGCHSRH